MSDWLKRNIYLFKAKLKRKRKNYETKKNKIIFSCYDFFKINEKLSFCPRVKKN